jgi:protein-S-isoprenylcysteine O-methyltransferase Ste14
MSTSQKRPSLGWLWMITWPLFIISFGLIFLLSVRNPSSMALDFALPIVVISAILIYCQLTRRAKVEEKKLSIEGFYRLTRHPIYHLFFADNICLVFATSLNAPWFWALEAMFIICLIITCVLEERVVRAEWGLEAERYYARTPRFIFEWIWFWWYRPKL